MILNLDVEAGIRINRLEGENFLIKSICLFLLVAIVIIAVAFSFSVIWGYRDIKKDIKEIKKEQASFLEEIKKDRTRLMAKNQSRSTRPPILIC